MDFMKSTKIRQQGKIVDYNNNVKNEKSLWNRFILIKLWIFIITKRRIILKNFRN